MDPFHPPLHGLLFDRTPAEIVVASAVTPCMYIQGNKARMPLRVPARTLTDEELALRLSLGDRRHGTALYTPSCPECAACEPIRVDAFRFRLGKTHRRIARKTGEAVDVSFGVPELTPYRMALYEKHLQGRGLSHENHKRITPSRFRAFLVNTCCRTIEIRYSIQGRLVGAAITDIAAGALSAHYTFFDPSDPKLSLGTFSILKQVELCQSLNLRYLYLGLYIERNPSMAYKGRFLPHERRIRGQWRPFEKTT